MYIRVQEKNELVLKLSLASVACLDVFRQSTWMANDQASNALPSAARTNVNRVYATTTQLFNTRMNARSRTVFLSSFSLISSFIS